MITIELPESIAERILPILKHEHETLGLQIRKIESSIAISKEDPSKAARNGAAARDTLPLMAPERTERGRAKKGESQKLIVLYLQSIKGRAAPKEIADATKTAYGSCLRVLRGLKQNGLANVKKRLWAWNTNGISSVEPRNDLTGRKVVAR